MKYLVRATLRDNSRLYLKTPSAHSPVTANVSAARLFVLPAAAEKGALALQHFGNVAYVDILPLQHLQGVKQ